jgi:putative oxidoreductase
MGMKMPKANAWIAALTEIGSGALLALGFLTPLAAAGMVAIMVVALITTHRKNGWFIFNPGGGIEYVVVLAAVGIGLACTGAGEWSIDHAADINWAGVPKGLIIVLVAGIGGGLLQLATFWRPKSVASN